MVLFFCIGGSRYDLNKITINTDGTYIVTKKIKQKEF